LIEGHRQQVRFKIMMQKLYKNYLVSNEQCIEIGGRHIDIDSWKNIIVPTIFNIICSMASMWLSFL
jgi:hypothetical protein